jgi:glyoxylase-like metal-dependent hydrolase (beta-lactamase superfamily II)
MIESGWPQALPRPGNRRLVRVESAQPWFEIYQVAPATFALVEPRHYEEVISYLILGRERAVLFDTGMGIGNIQMEVVRLTEQLPSRSSALPPVIVVNSHGHYDHVGDNYRFGEVWAFDHPVELNRIERGRTVAECSSYLKPGSHLGLPPGFDAETYQIRPCRVTRRLHHLEEIELGDRMLTAHHTPGHSAGSLCLLDKRSGLLFTGDTYYPGCMYGHFEDSDFAAYRKSIDHLVGLSEVRALCPAHNDAWVPPEELLRVRQAFAQVAAGRVAPEREEGAAAVALYRFPGFGLTLAL